MTSFPHNLVLDSLPRSGLTQSEFLNLSVDNPKSPKTIMLVFLVHFGIHAKSFPWHVRKHTGVMQSLKMPPSLRIRSKFK